jgi:hypothetical protein
VEFRERQRLTQEGNELLFGEAMQAAGFALTQLEDRLNRVLGRHVRLALGRYASVVCIGAPIAWIISGFRWDRTSTYGLIAGVVLYAFVDIVRAIHSNRPGRARR